MPSNYSGDPTNHPTAIQLPTDTDGPGVKAADVNPGFEGLADLSAWLEARLPKAKQLATTVQQTFYAGGHSGRPLKQTILTLNLPDVPADSTITLTGALLFLLAALVGGGGASALVLPQIDLTFAEAGGPLTSGTWEVIPVGANPPNGIPIGSSRTWVANILAASFPDGITNVVAKLAFSWTGNPADDDATMVVEAGGASLSALIGRKA